MPKSHAEQIKTAVLRAVCRPYSPVSETGHIIFRADAMADQLGIKPEIVRRELDALVEDDILVGENGTYLAMPNLAYAKAMARRDMEPMEQRLEALERLATAATMQVKTLEAELQKARREKPRASAPPRKRKTGRGTASRTVH